MMYDVNIPYAAYLVLTQEAKDSIDFQIQYGGLEEKDYFTDKQIVDRSFGEVKMLQNDLSEQDYDKLFKDILTFPEYKDFPKEYCWKVLLTFANIINQIAETIKMENEMLVSQVPHKHDYTAEMEQVDFSMFDREFNQLYELSDGDILKFDRIREQSYQRCFVMLLYRQKQNDFETLVMNKTSH